MTKKRDIEEKYLYSLNGQGRYTLDELCQYLGCSIMTVYRYVDTDESLYGQKIRTSAIKGFQVTDNITGEVYLLKNAYSVAKKTGLTVQKVYDVASGRKTDSSVEISRCYISIERDVITDEDETDEMLRLAISKLNEYENRCWWEELSREVHKRKGVKA